MNGWLWLALAASTLASEDLACVTAGLLIQQGEMSVLAGISSCGVGILAGDVGLWTAGRLGDSTLGLGRRIVRSVESAHGEWATRLMRGAPWAIVSSRFLPGTRLPLYVTAGLVGVPLRVFATWSALAVSCWTPLLVLGSAGVVWSAPFGQTGVAALGWREALAVTLLAVGLMLTRTLVNPIRRRRLHARVSRVWRWEFWPMWLFYPPVCLWIGWLSLRFGGLMTMTAANPGIEDGGTLGESKAAILSQLPHDAVIPFHLIDGSTLHQRLDQARKAIARSKWSFPIVMKPDVGERGTGVRLAHSLSDIEAYCATTSGAFLLQAYHPGPYEAGVFYYRFPGESRGQVLSITDKKFPLLVGDGRSTIEQLVWDHPRYRMQADVFLTRHAGQTQCVLHVGERFSLGMAGNHSKGTMFLDGEHLRTAALERRVDAIARQYPGFYIGRFDVRYSDVDAFKSGDDFAIVELNGATSEPTDLYDPRNSLWSAYRKLFTQWSLVFAIGAANRRRGAKVTSLARVTQLVRAHMARPAQGAD